LGLKTPISGILIDSYQKDILPDPITPHYTQLKGWRKP
jgi:hypothetical protein